MYSHSDKKVTTYMHCFCGAIISVSYVSNYDGISWLHTCSIGSHPAKYSFNSQSFLMPCFGRCCLLLSILSPLQASVELDFPQRNMPYAVEQFRPRLFSLRKREVKAPWHVTSEEYSQSKAFAGRMLSLRDPDTFQYVCVISSI